MINGSIKPIHHYSIFRAPCMCEGASILILLWHPYQLWIRLCPEGVGLERLFQCLVKWSEFVVDAKISNPPLGQFSIGRVSFQSAHAAHSEVCRCYRIAENVGKSE
ncbi:hypothetical protein [Pseudomonas sp. OV226]|uniref:hypothetical protein n=1 Tax=Pseudomonas sp. OV226 TaxID=2135588 RepID=UPI0011B1E178|nr:hypothetical protein [Pseudomonas sp. OV226]